jgi:hypothetical protein
MWFWWSPSFWAATGFNQKTASTMVRNSPLKNVGIVLFCFTSFTKIKEFSTQVNLFGIKFQIKKDNLVFC